MSEQNNVFKILEKVGDAGLKIQKENSDAAQTIQLSKTQAIKNQEEKPGLLLTTEDGRQFARLDSWPRNHHRP